jgi:MoxR-like ATPase
VDITKKNNTRISHAELKKLVKKYNTFIAQLETIFVGREKVFELLKYALLMRMHTMFFGNPGTSKTAIADILFDSIESENGKVKKFKIELTAFSGEDALFGPYDTKIMREQGALVHQTTGMLPEAHFGRIGEMLDANAATLRALLSSLNERRLVKGRQVLQMPLHTAYCDTNVDPYQFMRRNPTAWAVFDRIAFIHQVGYLSEANLVSEMVSRFQSGQTKMAIDTITLEEINAIADYIMFPPSIIQDKLIYEKYGEAVIEYRAKRKEKIREMEDSAKAQFQKTGRAGQQFEVDMQGIILPDISDRRVCWASQMIEISAVLGGRIQAIPEDMTSAHYILGTSEIERELWIEVITPKIAQINEAKKNQLSEAQRAQIGLMETNLANVLKEQDLDIRINGVTTLTEQIEGMKPEDTTVEEALERFKKTLNEATQKVTTELLNSKRLK